MKNLNKEVTKTFVKTHSMAVRRSISDRVRESYSNGKRRYIETESLVDADLRAVAEMALAEAIKASASNEPLVRVCKRVGVAVLGPRYIITEQWKAVKVGFALLRDVCMATGKFWITMKTTDDDGVPLPKPGYMLICTDKAWLKTAVCEASKDLTGTSAITYKPVNWTSCFDGGRSKNEFSTDRRLVHTYEVDILDRTNAETSPRFFKTINAIQSVPYNVNPTVLGVLDALEGENNLTPEDADAI